MQPEHPEPFPDDASNTLRDHRLKPRGVLPRHLQTWAMLAVAGGMLLVLFVTGRPTAPRRPVDTTASPANPSALPPDRLRRYQEQLAEQETRLRQELADAQAAATAAPPQSALSPRDPAPTDPVADERRRREYASLFADTVAFTRRAAGTVPAVASTDRSRAGTDNNVGELLARATPGPTQPEPSPGAPSNTPSAVPAPAPAGAMPQPTKTGAPAPGRSRLLEGTIIEAVLTNRLEGSFANPVNALVTTPVYAPERQAVLIPAGARVLGTASPVQALGETRLAVKFHRLVMPDGTTYDLDQFTGLNERGDAGLKDQVNRHYLEIFGASIAIGGLSGLAQFSTRGGVNSGYAFSDAFGQGMGGSLAASGGRILDRFLNVLPSITIREGHRLKIYLTRDLDLPPYRSQSARAEGSHQP